MCMHTEGHLVIIHSYIVKFPKQTVSLGHNKNEKKIIEKYVERNWYETSEE